MQPKGCVLLSVSFLLVSWCAAGQIVGTTIGAIHGTITDATGGVVPDVRVVISSNALMGDGGATRSGVTGRDGLVPLRRPALG